MNLEAIEQRTLNYLKQAANPLAPVKNLVRHLRSDPETADFEERELLEFLDRHELFRLMMPAGDLEDPALSEAMTAAGLPTGPCVILETRAPSPEQTVVLMQQQLSVMSEALEAMQQDARAAGDERRAGRIAHALSRAERMKKKLWALQQGGPNAAPGQ